MIMIPQYLAAHIQENIAEDPRTNVLDVCVNVIEDKVFLIGSVESEALRTAVEEVANGLLPPSFALINEICIANYMNPTQQEKLG
jgi:hypothetical protein